MQCHRDYANILANAYILGGTQCVTQVNAAADSRHTTPLTVGVVIRAVVQRDSGTGVFLPEKRPSLSLKSTLALSRQRLKDSKSILPN